MNPSIRPLSLLMISALSAQCVTPQPGVFLDSPTVQISCAYVGQGRLISETEVECMIANLGTTPARILFKQVSLEEPPAEIEPVDMQKLKVSDSMETVIVILGVILIVGVVIAILSKSKGPSVNVPVIHFGVPNSPGTSSYTPQKMPFADTFEIPANSSVRLAFFARHGKQRPQFLAIRLGHQAQEMIRVPIKSPAGWPKRSDF